MGKKYLEIERFYVLKAFHGNGYGRQMMNYCENFGRVRLYNHLWLGVWKQNPGAIEFYKKMGFTITGEHIFKVGHEEQWDWIMEKELKYIPSIT